MRGPDLLLFDLYTGGHHRQYLELIARRWADDPGRGTLAVAAPAAFFETHHEFEEWIRLQPTVEAIRLDLPRPLREGDLSLSDVLSNDAVHGRLLREVVGTYRPRHTLAMYFDHVQASLARGIRLDTRLSGIYFRPSFHYRTVSGRREYGLLSRARKRALLALAVRHRSIHHIFCLDPHAAEAVGKPLIPLPDGFSSVPGGPAASDVRNAWGVAEDHRVLLFFGVVSGRKGIHDMAAAAESVRPNLRNRLAIVIAGRVPDAERVAVRASLKRIHEAGASLITDHRFIDEADIPSFFAAADAAHVAYRRHIGSSNVLIRAASARIPVIGPEFGLMGRQIREHRLGIAVDTSDRRRLADGIERALFGTEDDTGFDAESAAAFADANSAERFTETILSTLFAS
jgi:glycosyltransferase involved in cell wall biosynthesis